MFFYRWHDTTQQWTHTAVTFNLSKEQNFLFMWLFHQLMCSSHDMHSVFFFNWNVNVVLYEVRAITFNLLYLLYWNVILISHVATWTWHSPVRLLFEQEMCSLNACGYDLNYELTKRRTLQELYHQYHSRWGSLQKIQTKTRKRTTTSVMTPLFCAMDGGGFFFACNYFGRMFDNSFPACAFFFFLSGD